MSEFKYLGTYINMAQWRERRKEPSNFVICFRGMDMECRTGITEGSGSELHKKCRRNVDGTWKVMKNCMIDLI